MSKLIAITHNFRLDLVTNGKNYSARLTNLDTDNEVVGPYSEEESTAAVSAIDMINASVLNIDPQERFDLTQYALLTLVEMGYLTKLHDGLVIDGYHYYLAKDEGSISISYHFDHERGLVGVVGKLALRTGEEFPYQAVFNDNGIDLKATLQLTADVTFEQMAVATGELTPEEIPTIKALAADLIDKYTDNLAAL